MFKDAQNSAALLFKESFIPFVLVALGIAAILAYVNLKATLDSNQVEIITIQRSVENAEVNDSEATTEVVAIDISRTRLKDPLYEKAANAITLKKWSVAEKIYKEIITKIPSSQAFNDLGVLYYNQKKYKKALEEYDKAIENQPVYLNAYVNRGLVYTKLKKYSNAINDYNAVIEKVPFHFQAYLNLGVAFLKANEFSQAIATLKKSSSLAGGVRKAKALYNLGLAYRGTGKGEYKNARKSFLAAVRIRPAYTEARFALAALEPNTTKGRENALAQYNKVLDLIPQYPPAYFRIAQIMAAAHDQQAAEQNYIKAIQYNPKYTKARYNLGLSYLTKKRWDDARTQFKYILEQQSDVKVNAARVHFQLGRAAYGVKDFDTALSEYKKAVSLKKGIYEKALLNIGLTYRALGQYEKSISTYIKVLELNDEYPQAWYNLGLAHMRDKEYSLAEGALKSAIKYKTKYPQAWFNLGVLYRKQDRFYESMVAYKTAISMKPNYRKAKLNLAVRYAQNNQFKDAIYLYKDVLKKDDRYASAWINLGIAEFNLGHFNKAEEALNRALILQPENVVSKRYLAKILLNNNQYSEAIDLLKQAVGSKEEDAQLRFELGRAYNRAGNAKLAKSSLQKALKLDPKNLIIRRAFEEVRRAE